MISDGQQEATVEEIKQDEESKDGIKQAEPLTTIKFSLGNQIHQESDLEEIDEVDLTVDL